MKTKKFQITCRCSVYKFPHRLGGGKCNGSQWCQAYNESAAPLCRTCNNKSQGTCDVASGREDFSLCPAVEYCMQSEHDLKLPTNYNLRLQKLNANHEEFSSAIRKNGLFYVDPDEAKERLDRIIASDKKYLAARKSCLEDPNFINFMIRNLSKKLI